MAPGALPLIHTAAPVLVLKAGDGVGLSSLATYALSSVPSRMTRKVATLERALVRHRAACQDCG